MYGNPERGRGYRGRWKRHRGSYRGNFGARGKKYPTPNSQQQPSLEIIGFHSMKELSKNCYYGGGFKLEPRDGWKVVYEHRTGEQMKTAENNKDSESGGGGNAEDLARTTMSDGDSDDENREKTEHMESSREDPEKSQQWDLVSRNQFVCAFCKYRTLFNEEMKNHLQSEFHKEHLHYLRQHLDEKTVDFLQDYMKWNHKKAAQKRGHIEDTTIQQLCQDLDCIEGLRMEHFVRKVKTYHCIACNNFVPMDGVKWHLKSPSHNVKCRSRMEASIKTARYVGRSFLKDKKVNKKLEKYLKGQDPFIEHDDDDDDNESVKSVCSTEAQEAEQAPCSSASESGKRKPFKGKVSKSQKKVKSEDAPGGEDAEDYACEAF